MVQFLNPITMGRLMTRRGRSLNPRGPAPTRRGRPSRLSLAPRLRLKAKTKTALGYGKRKRNPMAKKVVRGAIGGQATFSKFYAANRPSPRVLATKRVGAPNIYVTNAATQVSVLEGFQEYGWCSTMSTAALKQIATYVVPAGVAALPKRFVLESATNEFMITNSSLATMYVDIYDIVRKRDADSAFAQTYNPGNAWSQGVQDQVGGPNYYRTLNSLPTDSQLLKDYFKIVQRSHVGLAQGATHKHHVALKPNKLIDTALLNTCGDNDDLAGHAVYTLFVCYGQPASVPQEGGVPAVVTTASGYIDIVNCSRYKYTWVADNTSSWFATDNLVSTTGEQIISAGAGAIVLNQKV